MRKITKDGPRSMLLFRRKPTSHLERRLILRYIKYVLVFFLFENLLIDGLYFFTFWVEKTE